MLRRAGAFATSFARFLWTGGSPLHYHELLSAKQLLGTARTRDIFLEVLEPARRRYGFDVVGFVVMPEHIHLLISEPEKGDPSVVMQVLKQTVARRLLRKRRKKNPSQSELWRSPHDAEPFWQRRFYDFNVFSEQRPSRRFGTCTTIQ